MACGTDGSFQAGGALIWCVQALMAAQLHLRTSKISVTHCTIPGRSNLRSHMGQQCHGNRPFDEYLYNYRYKAMLLIPSNPAKNWGDDQRHHTSLLGERFIDSCIRVVIDQA